jgi:serine/threonine protein phosphatase PrpC
VIDCFRSTYISLDVHKRNQDAFSITHDFAGQPGDSLFVIYDGHGKNGDVCAIWAKKHLPRLIAKYIKQERVRQNKLLGSPGGFNPKLWPLLTPDLIQAMCMKAHLECNQLMHDDKSVSHKKSARPWWSVVPRLFRQHDPSA